MQFTEAIKLIQHPVPQHTMAWADLGCGEGLFTNALSQLLFEDSIIYAVDKNKRALNNVAVKERIRLKKLALNFVNDELPFRDLSGILMTNAFHFVKDKNAFIKKIFSCLEKNGYLLIVEYDTNAANMWVPYPVNFNDLKKFFEQYNCTTEKLNAVPSKYRGSMYSALVKRAKQLYVVT